MRKIIFVLILTNLTVISVDAKENGVSNKTKVTKIKPSVAVELLKMNVLYIGVDNPMNIATTNASNFSIETAKGTIIKRSGFYSIIETTQGVDTMFIYDAND